MAKATLLNWKIYEYKTVNTIQKRILEIVVKLWDLDYPLSVTVPAWISDADAISEAIKTIPWIAEEIQELEDKQLHEEHEEAVNEQIEERKAQQSNNEKNDKENEKEDKQEK